MVGKGNQMFQRDNSHSETENTSEERPNTPFVSGTMSIRTFRSFLFDNMRLMAAMVTYGCSPSARRETPRAARSREMLIPARGDTGTRQPHSVCLALKPSSVRGQSGPLLSRPCCAHTRHSPQRCSEVRTFLRP